MSSPTSTPGSAPKSMSSRLLTMKFMQRAAASTPSSPTPDEPSSKRQKKNSDSPLRTAVDSEADALAEKRILQAALDAEEAKRQVALDKLADEAGDTRWVLSYEDQAKTVQTTNRGLHIIQTGYTNLDAPPPREIKVVSEEDFEGRAAMVGRRSFGRFNKALEKEQGTFEESSDSESDSDSADEEEEPSQSDGDVDDPMQDLIKAGRKEAAQKAKTERQVKKKAEKAQLQELSKKRKKKEVKLNMNRASLTGRQERPDTRTCYTCGGPHMKLDCPQNQNGPQKRLYPGGDDGPSPKTRKVK